MKKLLIILMIVLFAVPVYAERFFSLHSTWYEKIPADAVKTSYSDVAIAYYVAYGGGSGRSIQLVDSQEWGKPIWYADADTPLVTIVATAPADPTWVIQETEGWTVNVPMPLNAKSAGMDTCCLAMPNLCLESTGYYRDGLMTVVNADRTALWEFVFASKCSGDSNWKTYRVRKWDLTKTGVIEEDFCAVNGGCSPGEGYDGRGATHGTHTPLIHGTITYDEVVNDGVIDHVINISVPWTKQSFGIYPSYGRTGGSASVGTDPARYGERVQLDPTIDCSTHYGTLNSYELAVCTALQEYGGIIVDSTASDSKVWLEGLVDKPETWTGKFPTLIFAIIWDDMRIVDALQPPFNSVEPKNPTSLTVE